MPVQLTLLYDSECDLCRRFQETVARWDTDDAVACVSLDDPSLLESLTDEELVAAQAELTVIDADGTAHRGEAALRRLTEVLPGVRRLSWAHRLPGVTAAVGVLYRGVQRRRARKPCLNCGEKWMPSKKWSRRGGGRGR
ncbi:MAG: DCC1-like thiol-disulfide oxidoreductase family protein [Candidatus Latescibacterota bacterium]